MNDKSKSGRMLAKLTPNQWLDWLNNKTVNVKVISEKKYKDVYESKEIPSTSLNNNLESYVDNLDSENSGDDEESMFESVCGEMDNLDIDTILSAQDPAIKSNTDVYNHYDFKEKPDCGLPIYAYKNDILSTVEYHQVTIVHGSTGTGKSTQLPMYILEQYARRKKYCNIIVTQPRRLAALSVARRVSKERKWSVGQVVGYQVGLEKETSCDTRITYVTTGVLLQILIRAKSLNPYTHIIMDEVHERDKDTDLALLIVKKLLFLNSRHVRVVLMSATMDTTDFAKYFSRVEETTCSIELAPTISIEGKMFRISEHFLDDLSVYGAFPTPDYDNPCIEPMMYDLAARLIWDLDQREKKNNKESSALGAVLVFLPGLYQIEEMENTLRNSQASKNFLIISLHSTITLDEQRNIFSPLKNGFRKVILSTNIAESSLTVPDVKYVVDFCLTKQVVNDHTSSYQSLQLQWASKSNCKQRAGRAGRVSEGMVFHLVTRKFYNEWIPKQGTPELQRCSLESAILRVKQLDLGSPKHILRLAMSPPNLTNIARSIMLLREVGALSASSKKLDGRLTFVGNVLASLPLDMRLGKLLVLGYVFGCLKDCIVIAACLSKSSFFVCLHQHSNQSFKKKLAWAKGTFSDCLASLNAYNNFQYSKENGIIKSHRDAMDWSRKNHIHLKRIKEVESQVQDLTQRLERVNIHTYRRTPVWNNESKSDSLLILQVVLAGAFYPNYFEMNKVCEEVAFREMSTLNPNTTVTINNLPLGEGPLFKNSIIHALSEYGVCKKLYYNGRKVMVEFEKDKHLSSSQILSSVYLASKGRRNFRKRLQVYKTFIKPDKNSSPLTSEQSKAYSFYYENTNIKNYKCFLPVPLLKNPLIQVMVTHVSSLDSFWGLIDNETSHKHLHKIKTTIQRSLEAQKFLSNVKNNSFVLAPYKDGLNYDYYRALVLETKPKLKVWFVDYGNIEIVENFSKVIDMPSTLLNVPFLAVKFELCNVMPIAVNEASANFLSKIFQNCNYSVWIKVYSIVADVVRAEVCINGWNDTLNKYLINEGKCDEIDESLFSQQEHKIWEWAETDEETFKLCCNQWHVVDGMVRGKACKPYGHETSAKGPFSTLETEYHSMFKAGSNKSVKVCHSSINEVVLDTDISGTRKRFMVASDICVSQTGSSMTCRDTTLLPAIPALSSLICITFAPIVDLRYSKSLKRFTGALCGLGAVTNLSGGTDAVLPEHDIELKFSRIISKQDIEAVNGIRAIVNTAIGSSKKISEWNLQVMRRFQESIRTRLIQLIHKPRMRCDEVFGDQHYCCWKSNNDSIVKNEYYPIIHIDFESEDF